LLVCSIRCLLFKPAFASRDDAERVAALFLAYAADVSVAGASGSVPAP